MMNERTKNKILNGLIFLHDRLVFGLTYKQLGARHGVSGTRAAQRVAFAMRICYRSFTEKFNPTEEALEKYNDQIYSHYTGISRYLISKENLSLLISIIKKEIIDVERGQ